VQDGAGVGDDHRWVLCDRCADRHISSAMGLPLLPDPPEPLVIRGPDGRRHTLRFRLWRAPTGISVELREARPAGRQGYEFAVLGAHDADVDTPIARTSALARGEIGHCYLRRDRELGGWSLNGDEVAGRLAYDPDGGPCRVVVDGRQLGWEELGHALASFEGWRFRLVIDDPAEDLRPGCADRHAGRPRAPITPEDVADAAVLHGEAARPAAGA